MRYSTEHTAATRRRIVDGAAAALRERGLGGVGVADLMRQAGLTHGGFYAHFASKDALVGEAIDLASRESVAKLRAIVKRAGRKPVLAAIAEAYLSPAHRDRPERGCALAALGTEGARESPAARRALAAQMESLLGLLADHVAGVSAVKAGRVADRPGDARRRRAMAVLSCLVGALVLSRIADRSVSNEILSAARRHLADSATPRPRNRGHRVPRRAGAAR